MTPWLLPWTAPLYIQGHVIALLTFGWAWWGRPHYRQGMLLTPWREGFKWGHYWVTTIATWMGYPRDNRPEPGGRLWYHEVESHASVYEDHCVRGAILGGVLCFWSWRLGLTVWLTSGPLWELPGYLTALARYWKPGRAAGIPMWKIAYRGHALERMGYSEDDHFKKLPWEVT